MNVQLAPVATGTKTRDIMGVEVVAATAAHLVAELDARVAAGDRVKLAFLNAHGSNLAAVDDNFHTALQGFTVINDGIGVDIASRILHGARFPENLNGTDFVPRYLTETRRDLRIYLLGSPDGVAGEAAGVIAKRWPRHTVVGTHHGFFRNGEAPSIARGVAATRADLILVALGNPRQELFIARYFDAMTVPMAFGVGALLDFMAGRVSRAPAMIRRVRMEWVYRLAIEPRRMWRRYILGNSKFLWRLMAHRLGGARVR